MQGLSVTDNSQMQSGTACDRQTQLGKSLLYPHAGSSQPRGISCREMAGLVRINFRNLAAA